MCQDHWEGLRGLSSGCVSFSAALLSAGLHLFSCVYICARMVSSALTDRWDDPAEVCRWLSGPWGAPLLAFPSLYPHLPPWAAPRPACSYLSQWRTLTEKGTWLLAWGRGGGGSRSILEVVFLLHFTQKGRKLLCNLLCFGQAGRVLTSGAVGSTSYEPQK